jgi:hypothetical protein
LALSPYEIKVNISPNAAPIMAAPEYKAPITNESFIG